jgi:hypothetical protein
MTGIQHTSGWSPEKRVLIGLAAIVVVGLLEDAARLRRRAVRALSVRLQDFDAATSHGAHRSEIGMFIAGLTGTRRHGR